MTIGDILVNTNRATLENLLPLTEVKTQEDFAKFEKKGYTVGITAEEFQKKYPLLPVENIYASYNILSSLYYCELDNPTIPIVLNLQIYGDKRLTVASESDEEFQKRVLSIAKAISEGDMKQIRSYLFPSKIVSGFPCFHSMLRTQSHHRNCTTCLWIATARPTMGFRA